MGVTMYSEKKYGILLMLIGEIAIGLALPRITVGINNPSDERQAALHIMDLIGEKIGEMIVDRGANDDDQNDEENLRFNPLRFAGKRGLWGSIYDNDKRGFNPKQIKDLIGEKRFNPSRFAGYGNRRIRSIWPVQSARNTIKDIVLDILWDKFKNPPGQQKGTRWEYY